MKIMGIFSLMLVQLASPLTQAAPYRVLLTSFDPFGGSPQNNSQPIVHELSQMADTLGTGIEIQTCNLPVVYDADFGAAMACVKNFNPDLVVSFGEAACTLLMETAANNLDHTPDLSDNAGVRRVNSPILIRGPRRSGFNFPAQAMYCGLAAASEKMSVRVSQSPGNFVCNNLAYHLSQEMGARKIPFTKRAPPCERDFLRELVGAY